uniref:BTB domain-containing protein n=1 Tax=Panagrellus redivivus TaxID=6233 RepID=A0A7E4W388_PANRE
MPEVHRKGVYVDQIMIDLPNDKVRLGSYMTPPRPIKGTEHLSYSFIVKGFDNVKRNDFKVYLYVHGGPIDLVTGSFYIVQRITMLNAEQAEVNASLNQYRRIHIYTGPKLDPLTPDLRIVATVNFKGFEQNRTNFFLESQPLSIWKSNEKLTITDIREAAEFNLPQATLIVENKTLRVCRDLLNIVSPIFEAMVNNNFEKEPEFAIYGFDYQTVESAINICKGLSITSENIDAADKMLHFAQTYCIPALIEKLNIVIAERGEN